MSYSYARSAWRATFLTFCGLVLLLFGAQAQGVATGRVYTRDGESFRLYVDGNAVGGGPGTSFNLSGIGGGYHWLEFRFPGRRLAPNVTGFRTQAWFAPGFESVYELWAFPQGGRMTLTRVSYAALDGGSGGTDGQPGGTYYQQGNQANQQNYAAGTTCQGLLTPAEVDQLLASLQARDFENTRLALAKDVVGRSTILSQDVKRIMKVFDFENSRLDFAKFAYNRCCDQRNYYTVNDAFDFDASVQALQSYTRGR